jgi:hypothetical protein
MFGCPTLVSCQFMPGWVGWIFLVPAVPSGADTAPVWTGVWVVARGWLCWVSLVTGFGHADVRGQWRCVVGVRCAALARVRQSAGAGWSPDACASILRLWAGLLVTGLRLQMMGPLRVWRGDVEVDAGPRQQRALLALLLAQHGRPVGVGELIELLWAADPPATATNIIQKYVGALRRLLEPAVAARSAGSYLVRDGNAYRLSAGAQVLDLAAFHQHVTAATATAAAGRLGEALNRYVEALHLCRGPRAVVWPTARPQRRSSPASTGSSPTQRPRLHGSRWPRRAPVNSSRRCGWPPPWTHCTNPCTPACWPRWPRPATRPRRCRSTSRSGNGSPTNSASTQDLHCAKRTCGC